MNAIKNRIVFFTTLFIWIIFYYFILDISSFNPETWHYVPIFIIAFAQDFFIIFLLPLIVTIGYGFLTFNKDDHAIFMDNLYEMLEKHHRKELQKDAIQKDAIKVYKSVFPEDEGDEKNQPLEEEQEESLSLWEWYDNFICYFHYRKGYSTNYNFDEFIKLKPILEKELELERLQILGCLVISRIVTHLAVLLGYLIAILMWFEPTFMSDLGYLGLLLFPIGLWLVSIIFMWLLIYVLRHLIFLIGI